jgi:hypothetical protein
MRIQEDDRPYVVPWHIRRLSPEQLRKRIEKRLEMHKKKQAKLALQNEKLLKKQEKKQSLKSRPQNI